MKLIKYLSKFDSFGEQCCSLITDLKKYEDEEFAQQVQRTQETEIRRIVSDMFGNMNFDVNVLAVIQATQNK